MTKVAIVTDSTAALSDDTVQKMANVFVVPIVVNMNGITYREGIDITNEQFYTALAKAKQLPTTAPPTPMEMLKVYDNLANQGYDDIISIHLTSGITGFVNNLTTVVRATPMPTSTSTTHTLPLSRWAIWSNTHQCWLTKDLKLPTSSTIWIVFERRWMSISLSMT